MSQNQVFNPFLPLTECIPDGEPHVFGDRVYIFGSHDKLGGETFCMLDYTTYSAPVTDLTQWTCHGTIYKASQDPDYKNRKFMYAPDVVQGNDGRFYLYYCMSGDYGQGGYFGPISVAVCDTPGGHYEYLGFVKNADGSPLMDYVPFDPGVINDNGTVRLYYGTQYEFEMESNFEQRNDLIEAEMHMFNKSRNEILEMYKKDSVMGAVCAVLENDMVTVKEKPRHIIPYYTKGTPFEEHPFFEASSIRKICDTYYFIYSSRKNHELCYATSKFPDRDFTFRGTIVSNGDVGLPLENSTELRTDSQRLNMTGTTHGSIENINGNWYVFYHRLTHKSDYSRQACAEKIEILSDGSIKQVPITSCGLNGKALTTPAVYPAAICCNLTNGKMPHGSNRIYKESFPNVNHEGNEVFVTEISDGTLIGYKYFEFTKPLTLKLTVRGLGDGYFIVSDKPYETNNSVQIKCTLNEDLTWKEISGNIEFQGTTSLYLLYKGKGLVTLKTLEFC